MVIGILNSFYAVFGPLLAPTLNFIQIGRKTQVENFCFWSVWVGRAGRSKNGRGHFKLILCCFLASISPHAKFHPNRTENTVVTNFRFCQKFWSVWVGRAGRSKNGCSHYKNSESISENFQQLCFPSDLDEIWYGC